MIIIAIQFGEYPEIFRYNEKFKPSSLKMRLTLSVVSSAEIYRRARLSIVQQFDDLLPCLKKHSCGGVRSKSPFLRVIHSMEHAIIDLISLYTPLKSCSGVSGNFKRLRGFYDIFVECIDKETASNVAWLVVWLVQKTLADYSDYSNEFEDDYWISRWLIQKKVSSQTKMVGL